MLRRRLWGVLAFLLVLFGVVVGRVAQLQVLSPDEYVTYGESQRIREIELAADRGSILDRNGEELALSVPQTTVYTDPLFVTDAAAAATLLAPVLDVDEAVLRKRLGADNRFGYLARQVDDDTADAVRTVIAEEELTGIYLTAEPERFNPADDLARSVLGEVDVDGNGLSGLESQYAEALVGTPGSLLAEQASDGRTIPMGKHAETPPVKGDDLVLTLDRSVQFEAEQTLIDQVEAAGARGGTAVVTDPSTGEILAMATVVRASDGTVHTTGANGALTTVYEPGSVMKLVTVAGAIEAGVVSPDTSISVPDQILVGDHWFKEFHPHGTVNWTVAKILAESSNVGTIKIGKELGDEGIADSFVRFGFGAPSGLEFPNEQTGHVPAVEDWWSTSSGTIPIGQGVSATPLQVLLAYNTIANGGEYVAPSLVRATVDADGTRHPVPLPAPRRVVSEQTAAEVNLMLREVVSEGTGAKASVRGYTPAGKTGTARKVQPSGGYYDSNGVMQYQSTFVGFVPAEDPAYSIIIVIDEPDTSDEGYTGGMVAAPAFARLAEFTLRHGEVAPPRTDEAAVELGLSDTAVDEPKGVLTLPPDPVAGTTPPTTTPDGKVRAEPAGSGAASKRGGSSSGSDPDDDSAGSSDAGED